MKCYICDATLSDQEVQWNADHEEWDPCGTCLQIIEEVFEPLSEDEVRDLIEAELEPEQEGEEVDSDEEFST